MRAVKQAADEAGFLRGRRGGRGGFGFGVLALAFLLEPGIERLAGLGGALGLIGALGLGHALGVGHRFLV